MASHKDWSLATRALLRIKTRVLLFNLGPPEPLGQVRISYFGGCQHLWAGPLYTHHILLRGYRLLVPSRPGLISYHIQVLTYFIPFTASSPSPSSSSLSSPPLPLSTAFPFPFCADLPPPGLPCPDPPTKP